MFRIWHFKHVQCYECCIDKNIKYRMLYRQNWYFRKYFIHGGRQVQLYRLQRNLSRVLAVSTILAQYRLLFLASEPSIPVQKAQNQHTLQQVSRVISPCFLAGRLTHSRKVWTAHAHPQTKRVFWISACTTYDNGCDGKSGFRFTFFTSFSTGRRCRACYISTDHNQIWLRVLESVIF